MHYRLIVHLQKWKSLPKAAESRGLKVIIAAAGMAAHLPGVIASMTTLPVIGVPIKASLEGLGCPAGHCANASRHSGCHRWN